MTTLLHRVFSGALPHGRIVGRRASNGLLGLGTALVWALVSMWVFWGRPEVAWAQDKGKVRLRVAIVIDASGSMKKQDRNLLSKTAAKLFVDLLGPRDEVGIVEFGTRARLIDRAFVTGEQARVRLFAAIDKVGRSEECTDYRAGLEAALEMFRGKPETGERRLVIFLTDGMYDPDRSNEAYYKLLTPSERESLFPKKAQDLLAKASSDPLFRQRPCMKRYEPLAPGAKAGFLKAFRKLVESRLAPAGVRTFVIGIGTELGGGGRQSEEVSRSIALLKELAAKTQGRALIEHDVGKIPGFFAEIFAALVGAPVEALPPEGRAKAAKAYEFKVVRGTRAVAVVVPVLKDPKFELRVVRLDGGTAQPVQPSRVRHVDEKNPKGRGVLSGYRLVILEHPKPGKYRVESVTGRPFRGQVIQDVGLQLRWLEPKPRESYPEAKKGELTFKFGLRTASGEKVSGLSRKFLKDMAFGWMLRRGMATVAAGKVTFDPGAPMKPMLVKIPAAKLSKGTYELTVWGGHTKGFFDLPRLSARFGVVQYIRMEAQFRTKPFQVKPREHWSFSGWLWVGPDRDLESVQWFWLDFSKVQGLGLVSLRYSNDTPGCEVKGKKVTSQKVKVCLKGKGKGVSVDVALSDWLKARKKGGEVSGLVGLSPVNPEVFKGKKSWETKVSGTVTAWTIWDWIAFYKKWIIATAVALFILLWLLGRVLAGAFPPKATLYYVDLEDSSGEPSRFALGRRVKSHLPFVSAKHDIGGRKGMPRGGRVLATLVAAAGGGFSIVPKAGAVTTKEDKEEHREAFRGRYGDHYLVGDRYEFWVTRQPED